MLDSDSNGKIREPGRLRAERVFNPLDDVLPSWLAGGSAGSDAGATYTSVTAGDTTSAAERPGMKIKPTNVVNRTATLRGPAVNMRRVTAARVRLVASGGGASADMQFGFMDDVDSPSNGLDMLHRNGDAYATLRAATNGTITEDVTPYAWNSGDAGTTMYDWSLWVTMDDSRVYLGMDKDTLAYPWKVSTILQGVNMVPYVRVTTRTGTASSLWVHKFDVEYFYS